MVEQSPSAAPQDGSGGSESLDNLVLQAPQPMREDYIQNAVKFLSHPKVKGSPVFHRRSFLEKKGLTKEEIDEAFRRVPDTQPNNTNAAAASSQQAAQSPQVATGSVTAEAIVPHAKAQFSWVHALLGAGLFLGFGATAAITLKKLFVPRLKSWTRRVVAEGDENAKDEVNAKLYEEIKEAIKVSASAFSDIARTNQEVLASKDEERKILMKLTEAFDTQVNVFKSLSETLNHIRENRFSQYNLLEENIHPAPWNGPIDNQWRASQQTNMYTTLPNSGFDSGRHSLMPLPTEATYGSFPGSYSEQRVQRPGHVFQPQMSNDRLSPSPRGSYNGVPPYQHAGNAIESPAAVAPESPFQRRWVPPQPPGVIMPEAAAAIRQPRSIPRQQSQSSDGRPGADASRPPESAVREHMNGASEASGGGLPSDGSTMTGSAGSGENEEQQPEAA
ncbi:hypothetical protein ACP70R_031299 [Stipagrostis hirtigluma subsp. patula]